MPRHQRYRRARPPRRARVRPAIAGVAVAALILLGAPAFAPRGSVLDLRSDGAVAVPGAPAGQPGAESPAARPGGVSGTPTRERADDPRPPLRQSATSSGPAPISALEGYQWPLAHARLTLPFGPSPWGSRLVDGESFHDGVDLATFCGDRIRAAHDGTVIAAGRRYDRAIGWVGDLGPYLARLDRKHLWGQLPIVVVIDDGNGYRSIYAHFSRIVVGKGDVVEAGDLLGYEGMTGRASGCHLHYGLFSPAETATFRIRPDVVRRMKVPREQIARVDPLLVLPPKPGINGRQADRR